MHEVLGVLPKKTTIVVNGALQVVETSDISYEQIAELSGNPNSKELIVSWHKRADVGKLSPGQSIQVEADMVIRAAHTGAA